MFDKLFYYFRRRELCRGISCYVWTANRKEGVPYCHSCQAEDNPINHKEG